MVEGAQPFLLSTDFHIDFKQYYETLFGEKTSSSNDEHLENFRCGQNLTDLLGTYTKRFLYDVKTFLDLQTTSYVNSVITEAANTTTTLTDHNRGKRDLGAIALTMAVISLLSSAGALVYYTTTYQGMLDHLKNLYRSIEQDRQLTSRIVNDVKILRTGEGQLAIRTNSLYEIVHSLRLSHACGLLRQISEVELTRISMEYKLFLSDIISENLSDCVIPLSLLVKLSQKGLLKGSLIESDLTLFYSICKMSPVSVDVEQETLLLTISCPRLKKRTDFLTFTILAPPLTVKAGENRFLTRSLTADFENLAVPIQVLERANFSLANMTLDDLKEIRRTDDCVTVHSRQFCRRLLPVPPATFRCLASMTKYGGGGTLCPQLESISTSESLVNYKLGRNFAVIFQPDHFDVRGNTGKLETVIHHARSDKTDKYVCLVVPSRFQTVTILDKNKKLESFAQAISFAYNSVLGFKPEDAFVTKKLFSKDFSENFKLPNKNFFSLNETAWETLEPLPDIFTQTMNLPVLDASVTTICLLLLALVATGILLLICCRRSMICWRCLTSAGTWLINGRGLFGVEAMDTENRRAKSVSPLETANSIEETRSTAPLSRDRLPDGHDELYTQAFGGLRIPLQDMPPRGRSLSPNTRRKTVAVRSQVHTSNV